MNTLHKTIIGDSRKMLELADNSVHLIITSPPYWQLKDYGSTDQIGFHDSYEDYINNLNLVWNECARVLHPGCRMCINIGDQFARSVYYGRYKVIPIRTEIIKFCESAGFDYMGAIIWQKVTTTNTTGGASIMGSFPYPRNGILKLDYEFILLFKKLGESPKPTREQKEASKLTTAEWNEYFAGHWNFPGERQNKHLAMFPVELPKRLIRMFSFSGETVLDPFLGSGTTSLAALQTKRNSVGYEINSEFIPVIRERLGVDNSHLFPVDSEWQQEQRKAHLSFDQLSLEELPYRFVDPLKLDKQVDPRKLQFGSKIQNGENKPDRFYSVKNIISANEVELDSGIRVRLLGVEPILSKKSEAMAYLRKATSGEKVFLKFEKNTIVIGDYVDAYLYLKNKTFLNAHLIKRGYASPSKARDHRLQQRFERYYQDYQTGML